MRHHDSLYCSSLGSDRVHHYSVREKEWRILPTCPTIAFALVVVEGVLTAVGGEVCLLSNNKELLSPTNTLYSFEDPLRESGTSWCVRYPPMPTKRSYCTAICYQDMLIVAGGQTTYIQSNYCLTTVEVLNTHTCTWFKAFPLPWPVRSPSLSVHNSLLYLAGGWDDSGTRPLKGDLHLLRLSCKPLHRAAPSKIGDCQVTVWEAMPPSPVCHSSCAVVGGRLMLIGGRGERGRVSDKVYVCEVGRGEEEEEEEVGWREVGVVPGGGLYHCLCVCVCGGEGVMVIGGLVTGGVATRGMWTAHFRNPTITHDTSYR